MWAPFRDRTPGHPKRKADQSDYAALRRAAEQAGCADKLVHRPTHVFRHSFGTMLYEQITDPKALQRLMRHQALKTTMERYVHDRRELGSKVNALPSLMPKRRGLRLV
jgi:integrase